MTKNFELTQLAAKVAIFFAKADGTYCNEEMVFIRDYLTKIQEKHPLSAEEVEIIESLHTQDFSLESLIAEMQAYLKSLPDPMMRYLMIHVMDIIIEGVTAADGVRSPEEEKAYQIWQQNIHQQQ